MHDIVASVPLLTMRTFSMDGTHSQIVRAISTSSACGEVNAESEKVYR